MKLMLLGEASLKIDSLQESVLNPHTSDKTFADVIQPCL